MKKCVYGILFCGFVISASLLATDNIVAPKPGDPKKTVTFDKEKYDEIVKKILRTKEPSFLSKAVDRLLKEGFYVGASALAGVAAFMQSDDDSVKVAHALLAGALAHTILRVLFDYLLDSKDQNLRNLESFEKYVNQTLSHDESLTKRDSDLIMRLFEKDYDLILNKLDQDRGAGIIKRFIKFVMKHSMLAVDAVGFAWGMGILAFGKERRFENIDIFGGVAEGTILGAFSGFAYFVALIIVFDFILASKDQRLAKIEKLRDVVAFFEEAKIRQLEVQHENIARSE